MRHLVKKPESVAIDVRLELGPEYDNIEVLLLPLISHLLARRSKQGKDLWPVEALDIRCYGVVISDGLQSRECKGKESVRQIEMIELKLVLKVRVWRADEVGCIQVDGDDTRDTLLRLMFERIA